MPNDITPGPWKIRDGSDYAAGATPGTLDVWGGYSGSLLIAEVRGCSKEANAKAIAAVPDLIAALQWIAGGYPETEEGESFANIAREALRKAGVL